MNFFMNRLISNIPIEVLALEMNKLIKIVNKFPEGFPLSQKSHNRIKLIITSVDV